MLVIHWAKHNKTNSILANGIRPSFRKQNGKRRNPKGVYVFPYSRNSALAGNWRHNLKAWDLDLANFNGFVFRLVPDDFPLIAGYWFLNRYSTENAIFQNPKELTKLYGDFFSGKILDSKTEEGSYNWRDFEIIIPRRIDASRIMKVLKDREPKGRTPAEANHE